MMMSVFFCKTDRVTRDTQRLRSRMPKGCKNIQCDTVRTFPDGGLAQLAEREALVSRWRWRRGRRRWLVGGWLSGSLWDEVRGAPISSCVSDLIMAATQRRNLI